MIPIYAEQVIYVFTIFFFLILGFLWLREELHRSRVSAKWTADKKTLYLCGKCHLSFLASRGQTFVRCPRCGELCFRRRRKRF
jgi:uncharacterized paraquat-inducible protein A